MDACFPPWTYPPFLFSTPVHRSGNMHHCAELCSRWTTLPMGTITCACRRYVARAEAPNHPLGIHGVPLFGYDSAEALADTRPTLTMRAFTLLRANRHHFRGLLLLQLLCTGWPLASHARCRLARQLLPRTRERTAYSQLSEFGIVLRLHNTDGSSSSQQPGERSSGSMSLGFMPDNTRSLVRSTCPFPWGCATDTMSSRILF